MVRRRFELRANFIKQCRIPPYHGIEHRIIIRLPCHVDTGYSIAGHSRIDHTGGRRYTDSPILIVKHGSIHYRAGTFQPDSSPGIS